LTALRVRPVRRAAPARTFDPPALPDIAGPGLRVLFVGINPSVHSAGAGHHFATRGNPFWRLLHDAGLTPVQLRPEEDRRLLEFGLGLTSACPRPTGAAAELTRAEQQAGASALSRNVEQLRPEVVALLGLSLYRSLFPAAEEPGPGPKVAPLAGAPVFVLPNPSGRNMAYPGYEPKLYWFRQLAAWVELDRHVRRGCSTRRPAKPGRT
jgi:double-stranded uracil-DNA glycosylase